MATTLDNDTNNGPSPIAANETLACVSIPKSGSTALAAALRRAGFDAAFHLHFLGPLAHTMGATQPQGSPDVSGRVANPLHVFRVVACVRDPIARLLSQAFHHAPPGEMPDRDRLIAQTDKLRYGEGSTPWFDDTFKTPFGFDFRLHPFDRERRSLRFSSPRLTLLVLRHEDPSDDRERELGWLVDRRRVPIPRANVSAIRFGPAYERFVSDFVAPEHWLDRLYETDVARHFYSEEERAAFRKRWAGRSALTGQSAESSGLGPKPLDSGTEITAGCVSLAKTGSMALTRAIRDAGFPDAVHLHFLGPRALAIKRAVPEPMVDLAIDVARRIEERNHTFRFVTAVRDPIARILSQAFYTAERHRAARGVDITQDREAVIRWWETNHKLMARRDIWSEWFDDTFKTTFGFDFRDHPFDHRRKSIRFSNDRLRLIVLRQKDERACREAELAWLLDRDAVTLRSVNDAAGQNYKAAYASFLDSFVAPSSWLDFYYESEIVRHVFTDEERAAFKERWSGRSQVRSTPAEVIGSDESHVAGIPSSS